MLAESDVETRGTTAKRSDRGFSLIELVVVVGMLLILAATAFSTFRRTIFDLEGAVVEVQGTLRLTRSLATGRGLRYRFLVTGTSTFEVIRLEEFLGSWLPSTDRNLHTLPPGIRLENPVGTAFEFDTRGALPDLTGPTVITIRDETTGAARVLSLWPSGQVVG